MVGPIQRQLVSLVRDSPGQHPRYYSRSMFVPGATSQETRTRASSFYQAMRRAIAAGMLVLHNDGNNPNDYYFDAERIKCYRRFPYHLRFLTLGPHANIALADPPEVFEVDDLLAFPEWLWDTEWVVTWHILRATIAKRGYTPPSRKDIKTELQDWLSYALTDCTHDLYGKAYPVLDRRGPDRVRQWVLLRTALVW